MATILDCNETDDRERTRSVRSELDKLSLAIKVKALSLLASDDPRTSSHCRIFHSMTATEVMSTIPLHRVEESNSKNRKTSRVFEIVSLK